MISHNHLHNKIILVSGKFYNEKNINNTRDFNFYKHANRNY